MTSTDAIASNRRQASIGLLLAGAIICAWIFVHIAGVFFIPVRFDLAWLIIPAVILQCWLYVGLFIIAHDCMHGSLVPFRPGINRLIGQICLTLYAGFSFDALTRKHHQHHRHSGTAEDPDFDEVPPHGFWRWFAKFFTEYFGGRQFLFISALTAVYVLVFGAQLVNVLLFWALPALLSSLQLFTFGTYLPHCPEANPFIDRHRARTNHFPRWLSLLTCFHFGYHHEHHLQPDVPWWRLPDAHADYLASAAARGGA